MQTDLHQYYTDRIEEYDRIYDKPERQANLAQIQTQLTLAAQGKSVLEIACGTGFWTPSLAQSARAVMATDVNEAMLGKAKARNAHHANVTFSYLDIYNPTLIDEPFELLFAGFLWSHIPKPQLHRVLHNLKPFLQPGGTMIFIDNTYVEGNSTPLVTTDADGNTYQQRTISNGTTYKIMKNYPTKEAVQQVALSAEGKHFRYKHFEYFWWMEFEA